MHFFLILPPPPSSPKDNNKINWALLCSNGTRDVEGFSKDFERALWWTQVVRKPLVQRYWGLKYKQIKNFKMKQI